MKRYVKASMNVYSTDSIIMNGNYVSPDKLTSALKEFGGFTELDTLLEMKATYNQDKNQTVINYKYIDDSATQEYDEYYNNWANKA